MTEWTWHTVGTQDRLLSASKRDTYLRYVDLPRRCGRAFQFAANIYSGDEYGDCELLRNHGWQLVNPHRHVKSPASYRQYIQHSRAEIACVKPVYRDLRTGWLSDRSACYLASGRPVLAEDTGFSDHLPTGQGLVTFRDLDEVIAGVAEIDGNYARHQRAARELAEEVFNSKDSLRVTLHQFNGNDLISVRIFYRDKDGELKPGKDGFSLKIEQFPLLARLLADAGHQLKELGLL